MAMSLDIVEEYRGITVDTLEEAGVWWKEDDDYAVRIPYPYLTGVWYERLLLDPRVAPNGRSKVLSPKNAGRHLYNPERLGPNAELVFFCEGEYDTLSVLDCGYPAVGSQGTGTFSPVWARLFSGSINIIAFDGDSAGVNASRELRKWFRAQGSEAYIMEGDADKDLNDLHQMDLLEGAIAELLEENEINYA